MLATVAC